MLGTVLARPTRLAGPQDFTEQSIVLRKIDQLLRAKCGPPESKPRLPPWHATLVFPSPSYYQLIHAPKPQGPTTPPPWVVIPWDPRPITPVSSPFSAWDWLLLDWDVIALPYFADFCLVLWGDNNSAINVYTPMGMALFYLPGISPAWGVTLLGEGLRLQPGCVVVSLPGQPAPKYPW